MSEIDYRCRICGLLQDEKPWGDDEKSPIFETCDCCGVEFGYEDETTDSIDDFREHWLKQGAKWYTPKAKPKEWNVNDQLKTIGIHLDDDQS